MMSPAAGDDDISTDDANQNTLYPTGEEPPELVKTVEEQDDSCEDAECKIESVIEEVGREGKFDDVDSCSTNGNVPACQPDSEATQESELATNPEKVQEISPVELSSQEGINHHPIETTSTESSLLTDETVAQNSRLKRKKAVKIKRSKTDEGLKELSFMRCNSLLDIDQKSAREASHSLGHRRSLVHDPELLRLEIAPSPFPSSSLAAFYPSDNDPYFSPPAPPLEGNFSPPVASDSCFSPPIGEPRQPRLLGRDGMNAAAAAAAKKTKSPPPAGPTESGGGCRTLFQRQKSVSGPMTMSGGGRDSGFPEDGAKKRTSVFRRKSSLADDESDRKPLTKRIFGPSKMSLQVLRKYSLASEYFTLRFESGEEQIVPAIKGISLWQAISELMQRHGVNSFEQVDVFLDSSKTPLPPTSDCFLLANTVLWVKAKDDLKRPEPNNIRSSLSVSNLSLLSNATDSVKEKRPSNGMFLKRTDPSSFSSSNPTVDSPVVHHIRSTQRPKSAPMKNEPHPLALPPASLPSPAPPRSPQPDGLGPRQSLLCPPSTFSSSSAEESVKTKKSVSSEDGSSLFDVSPSASLSHNDLLLQRTRGATSVATVATTGATVTGGGGGGGGGGATNATAATKGHSKLQSLFGPFNKVQDKHEQLTDLLNNYSQIGLPKMPDLLTLGRPNYDPQTFYIEPHWTDIVANHHTLSKRQRDQQEAIWELFTTEVEYIHKMKVIMDLFMCCLFNLQNEQILNEIEAEKLFSNIGDVFYSTCHFWKIHMSQVLKQARARRELLNPCLLKAGFLVFEKIFDPYTKYCLEQDNCREYIKQKTKENELFRTFISWAESQKQCNRLKLVDLIVKPFQRLTKYKLLLYAIKKPLDKMDSTTDAEEQKRDIGTMIEQVENFVFKVNVAMRQRHDYKQLLHMIERIEAYDAIEAPSEECFKLVSKFCKLDLTCPVPGCGQQQMRVLLLEGSLKLRDTYSKMDVYCFLFTDMLLITKPVAKRADRVKVIKPPMRLDKIVVHRLRDVASFMLLYLNEYHMAQAVYTFHGDSKLWLENVIKAQNDYKEKRNNYLTRTDAYDDIIDDVVCVEQQQQQQPSPASTVKRHDSSGSADTFLPNYGVQRSTSCTKEDQEYHAGTEVRRGGQSPALHTLALPYRAQLSVPYGHAENEKVSSSSESLSKELEGDQFFTVPVLPSGKVVLEARENPDDFGLEVEEGEELVDGIRESKFRSANQRRGARGERRYLTADTIQDLKTDKLRNVQKRLSWNCARFEDKDKDKDRDKGVLVGAESLRSMPSSSGVSSTASLYVVADGENGLTRGGALLSEDEEEEEDARCSSNSAVLSSYSSSSYSSSSYRRAGKLRNVETQTSDFGDGLLANFGNPSKVGEYFVESFVESSTRSLSQSLPDIAEFAVSKEEGRARLGANEDLPGGASIPSTPRVLLRRGLSSSQSSGMNQEFLLFNSTLEASDV